MRGDGRRQSGNKKKIARRLPGDKQHTVQETMRIGVAEKSGGFFRPKAWFKQQCRGTQEDKHQQEKKYSPHHPTFTRKHSGEESRPVARNGSGDGIPLLPYGYHRKWRGQLL